ncbi:MAG: site-specific DNA-methyltransferase, partial [Desulfobacterales bacterium]|nr:site-specific DNA-methyltransferase [Desulfobacterales bacterium]
AVLEECCRVLIPGGVMAINIADINSQKNKKGIRECKLVGVEYQKALRKHGVYLSDIIIWHKQQAWSKRNLLFNENTKHTSYRIMDNFEPVYVFRKEGERQEPQASIAECSYLTREQWKEYVDGVWNIQTVKKQDAHPNQWPEELPARLIRMFSFVGETVLDPFLGSGTTMKVAKELNRFAVGYEIQEQYKPVIMEKLGIEEKAETQEPGAVVPAGNEEEKAGPKAEFFSNDPDMVKEAFREKASESKTREAGSEG